MSFVLQLDQPLPLEVQRIASEQATRALSELHMIESNRTDYVQFLAVIDEGVHTVRTALKKARATLRLVRDEIGEDVYQRENASYRDAGRALSEMRDGYVLAKTLEHLRHDIDEADLERAVARIQAEFVAHHRGQRERLFADGAAIR